MSLKIRKVKCYHDWRKDLRILAGRGREGKRIHMGIGVQRCSDSLALFMYFWNPTIGPYIEAFKESIYLAMLYIYWYIYIINIYFSSVLYIGSWNIFFFSRAIKTNQDLLPETPWLHIFYNDFWGTLLTHSGSHKSYRPFCTLSFRLNHAVGGLNPWSYHLVNILLHAVVTGLFTSFSKMLLGDGYWTVMAGLMFASHPIHTEAVAGIVGRADVGASLFFLLSLLCYIKHCSTRGCSARTWGWILGTGLCAGCSMLWKEQGVTVLAVSAVYDVFVFHRLKMNQILPTLYKVSDCGIWNILLLACHLFARNGPLFSISKAHLVFFKENLKQIPFLTLWSLLSGNDLFGPLQSSIVLSFIFNDLRNTLTLFVMPLHFLYYGY